MIEKLDILVFSAHPDDAELACSGTIMKHIDAGLKVGIVDLTQGELGSRGTIETRYSEAEQASKLMGIHARVNLKMADGFFEINEENKKLIAEQIRRYQPNIVLANAFTDRHPDHGRAGKLVSEACFLSGLRMVETEWKGEKQVAHRPKAVYHYIQDYYIQPDFVVDVTDYTERKIEVIKAFKTQFFDPESKEPQTPISGEDFFDFVKSRMMNFGRPVGAKYAEGYTVERFPGVNNLMDLT
ncbi:MAG: bacillithiol biosynthesis deacetylase BshB1 [Crocinitomicaceae bacterium]|nr:bacillithiol biosynthesis deacetylase BshB1 [Crocinitomicaceae bacterium]